MSRCFPFPPPGYERKRIPEDLDLLKEAKRKEKKQKKEKKDKERKKDKEKKEKDGSDEKHREKKDRKGKDKDKKEKRKDKKDEEDRSKDKDKSSISEESTISGKLEEKNGDRLYPKGHTIARTTIGMDERKQQPSQGQNWAKSSSQSSLLPSSHGIEESKFVKELDRRIRDDKDRGSQLPENIAATMERRDKDAAAIAPPVRGSSSEKVDYKPKRVDDEKIEVLRLRTESDKRNTMVQGLVPVVECKVEETPRPLDRQNDKKVETKQKHEDKLKDRDKKNHSKDKLKEKEAKKEGKSKVKSENRKSEKGVLKEVGRNNVVGIISGNYKSTDELKDIKISSTSEGNIRKRKHMESNGFLHGTEISPPNKVPRPASSTDSLNELKENGNKHEITFRTQSSISSFPSTSTMGGVDNEKEWLVNGKSESNKPSSSKPCHPSPSSTSDQVSKALVRESGSFNGTPKKLINHQIALPPPVMLPPPKMNDQIGEKSVRILPPKINDQILGKSGPSLPRQMNEAVPILPPPKMKDQSVHLKKTKDQSVHLKKTKDQIAILPPKMKDKIPETSSSRNRPPHPDLKYLQEVLSVPNPLDWSAENDDDQEWLFSNKKGGPHSDKRAKLATSSLEEPPCVWSEAVYIQSADIYALPYVIPH